MKHQIVNDIDLIELVKILGQQTDYHEVLRLVTHKTAQFLNADLALILMLNPDTQETVKTIIKDGRFVDKKEYRDIHIHVGGLIIKTHKPFFSSDLHKDSRFVKGLFEGIPFKSVSGVPLIIEGVLIGAMILLYAKEAPLDLAYITASLENIAAATVPFLRNSQKSREFFSSQVPDSTLLVKYKNTGLYGRSQRFIEMLKAVEASTKCDVRVLLDGKTGTGKELIASAIHKYSSRADSPFIAVDCGAVPSNLVESEFFGHKKGAFTGADSDRQGLFVEANGGTLFMDEINNLPFEMQSKLLRVLQENEVRPVGGDRPVKINLRIIAASSVPLKKLVKEKKFREDLFFRLHVYPIYIPDLKERKEDITFLANHFLKKYARKQNKQCNHFHEEIIEFIKMRSWEGNIRELENFVERVVTLAPEDETSIDATSFPPDLAEELKLQREKQKRFSRITSLKSKVQSFEAELIKNTLIECDWNQSEAARKLNTSEKNIRYKIDTLNIRRPGRG